MNQNEEQIVVESANTSHIPAIIEIEEKTWITTYPNKEAGVTKDEVAKRFSEGFRTKRTEEISGEMANGDHRYRVLKRNGKLVGYSHLLKEKDFGDLVEIYILDEYQGLGYGSLMLKDGLKWLKRNGKAIRLEVATYNTKARAIYERYGFRVDPTLSQEKGEDWNLLPSGKRIPVIFMVLKC